MLSGRRNAPSWDGLVPMLDGRYRPTGAVAWDHGFARGALFAKEAKWKKKLNVPGVGRRLYPRFRF